MTTSITFENGTLIAAMRRLDKIAPRKGEAFDKAQGIVLDLDPTKESWGLLARVTNLETYYMEWLNYIELSGAPTTWRFSAALLAPVVAKLPAGSGKTTTFTELPQAQGSIGRKIEVKSGRIKAILLLLDDTYYPSWAPFNPEATLPVESLGNRIEQVAWAAKKGGVTEVLSGLRFNGETLVATDRYRLVSVPLIAPHLGQDIVVPISLVGGIIKDMGECRIGIDGDQLLIIPNDFTQIRCIMMGDKYPAIERVMVRDQPESVRLRKEEVLEIIGRVTTLSSGSRQPLLQMYLGKSELVLVVEDGDGINKIMEAITLDEGSATHDRAIIYMNPNNFAEALAAAPGAVVTMHYSPTATNKAVRLQGAHDFEAWCVPINPVQEASGN